MEKQSRLLLRIPPVLHRILKARAAEADVSVNALIERLLEAGLRLDPTEALVIETARRLYGDDFVGLLLFGSRARGDAHAGSDTDLLLVLRDTVRIERELYRTWDKLLPERVSLHLAHLPASPYEPGSLWLECALDGRIIADPTGRIGETIAELKDLITSGAFVRRTTHGQGYWVPR